MSPTMEKWRKRRERLRLLQALPRGTEHLRGSVWALFKPMSHTTHRPVVWIFPRRETAPEIVQYMSR